MLALVEYHKGKHPVLWGLNTDPQSTGPPTPTQPLPPSSTATHPALLIHRRRHTGAVWLLPKSFQHSGCDARSLPRLATPPPCLQLFSLSQTHPRMPPLIHCYSSTAKGTVPARWHVHAEYRINMPATPVSGLSYRQSRALPWHRPPKPCPCSSTAAHPPPSASPAGHVTSARRTRRRNALIQPGQCFALPADTTQSTHSPHPPLLTPAFRAASPSTPAPPASDGRAPRFLMEILPVGQPADPSAAGEASVPGRPCTEC